MLLFRSDRPHRWRTLVSISSILLLALWSVPALAKEKSRRKLPSASPGKSPDEQSLTNIPLAVGHEAKGLVLPDFDIDGHLRAKFEAGTARRIDEDHIGFQSLKITTYTLENTPDLMIEMSDSVLDMKTRVLASNERTTIKRADFDIVGDSVQFDTTTRTGRLIGNVKMVITDQSHFTGKAGP